MPSDSRTEPARRSTGVLTVPASSKHPSRHSVWQPDFEVTLSRHDFAELVFGRLHPMAGMATGRMRIKGAIKQAIKLDRLLKA